jgi:Domain of unknown function (DUF1929)
MMSRKQMGILLICISSILILVLIALAGCSTTSSAPVHIPDPAPASPPPPTSTPTPPPVPTPTPVPVPTPVPGPTPTPTPTPVHPNGVWTTLPYLMPVNPVHAFLIHEPISLDQAERIGGQLGKVFIVAGSGDDENLKIYQSAILDLSEGTITIQDMTYDSFCAGMTILPNGNPFLAGGSRYDEINSPGQELGITDASMYDLGVNAFVTQPSMAHGRWYGTLTALGDGRVMADSGYDQTGMNSTVEIFTPGVGWSPEYPMDWNHDGAPSISPFYMRQHVLPDGTVFYSSQDTDTKIFDPTVVSMTNSGWTHRAWTNYGRAAGQGDRSYGTSVLLPLTPENNYNPRVMIMGGDVYNSTDTTEIINLGVGGSTWQWGPKMSQRRVRMNALLLPDGNVLALGGGVIDEEVGTYQQAIDTASLNADLYDPATNTFSSAGANVYPRLDHTVTLLLPDATVWLAGNQGPVPAPGLPVTYEQHMEIYQPAYLFNPDGSYAVRPVIVGVTGSGVTPDLTPTVNYGTQFTVQTPDSASITSTVLIRPGATTHSFNTDQRFVGLAFTAGNGSLTVTAPPNHNIAPPGYYMLFLVNSAGVPSVAQFVQVTQ